MNIQEASEAAAILAAKHETIQLLAARVVRSLSEENLLIVDWRDADKYALAFALRSRPNRVAFVWRVPPGIFMLSTGSADADPHSDIESDPFPDLEALSGAIVTDLQRS